MANLKRLWAWVRAWRATRWAAITFVAQFVPTALKWTQQVYEFYAAGPASGHQLPGLNTLGYAAAAATTAVGVGLLGFLTDLAAKSPAVPLQQSRPAPETLPDPPARVVAPVAPGDIPMDRLVAPVNPGPLLGAVGGSGGVVGGHGTVGGTTIPDPNNATGGGFR